MQPTVEMNTRYLVGSTAASRELGISKSTFLRRVKEIGPPVSIDLHVARGVRMYSADVLHEWAKRA
jgi:hypothetical protein